MVQRGGKRVSLGYFSTVEEAAVCFHPHSLTSTLTSTLTHLHITVLPHSATLHYSATLVYCRTQPYRYAQGLPSPGGHRPASGLAWAAFWEALQTWEALDRAVGKAVAKKAVGADGFSTCLKMRQVAPRP